MDERRFRLDNSPMPDVYTPLVTPPADRSEPALWFAFHRGQILVTRTEQQPQIPCCVSLSDLGLATVRDLYLGTYGRRHCYVSELNKEHTVPQGHELQGLRDVFGIVDETLATLAGRAFQIMEWDRNHQFCSRCGTPTDAPRDERKRACPKCRYTVYPPVSPAIMILIMHGKTLLLARRVNGVPGRFSALAGFVEPGETLEDTVRRETREEVGIEIKNLRYFGSQPWPFPHSLMVAFTAEYDSGEVRPDGVEIGEARFFELDALPNLPPSISISRRLITTIAARLARGEKIS